MARERKAVSVVGDQGGREIEKFDPKRHRLKVAALDYGIEEAKRIKDWPALEEAVDRKIEEQVQFVTWWAATVRDAGGDQKSSRSFAANAANGLPCNEAEHLTGMKHQRVSDLVKRLVHVEVYRGRLLGSAYHAAMLDIADSQLVQQSLSDEHYTPEKYIDAARAVLGEIDLDPASCAEANETIRAGEFYSIEDNGLNQPWHGRVWLNPPYGDLVGKFIERLAAEVTLGNVTSAIALVNAHCTDTQWFRPLWRGLLCFTDHRINFTGDDTRSGSTHGSVFIYFGQERGVFIREFAKFGTIVEQITM